MDQFGGNLRRSILNLTGKINKNKKINLFGINK
jgi:hypothetical protein